MATSARSANTSRLTGRLLPLLSLAFFACRETREAETSEGKSAPAPRAVSAARPPSEANVLAISVEQQAIWVRNFNPFMAGKYRWPTVGPIYEPMFIYSTTQENYVPWLATEFFWGEGNRSLRFTLRKGVRWSDGRAFTSADVVFTFELVKNHPALDQGGLWKFVEGIQAPSEHEIVLTFKAPFTPGLAQIAQHPIVPAHVWSKIEKPSTFANETPVGTGPFTEVAAFRDQVFELARNPHYWQADALEVDRLRFPALASNEQALLSLLKGDVDWAGNFVPDIERVFVGKDPEHNGYWYPLVGSTVFLYANTTRKPFDDVRVRKALSMALDRKQMVRVAMYDYTRPADATALSDAHKRWLDDGVAAEGWVRRDVQEANRLLDAAGLARGPGGIRRRADGTELTYQINVVSGWSDWVRACQVIAKNLSEVGISASVKPYDFGAWFDRLQTGDFDLSISWSSDGVTPYSLYRDVMATETVKPIGERSAINWHRLAVPEADAALREFERTADPEAQKVLLARLEKIFSANAPAIPLFLGPAWGVFSTRRFTGFPSAANPFAILSPNAKSGWQAEYMLVLMALKPLAKDAS